MPRTDLTPHQIKSDKTGYAKQTLTMSAADTVNLNSVPHTGKEVIIARNSGASPYTVTITSVADPVHGRTGDIAAASLAAGEVAVFGPYPIDGWRQSDARLYFQASNAAVLFTVLRLP